MESTISRFRTYLVAWFVLTIAFFAWINFFGGKDHEFDSFAEVWDPFYVGLLYSTSTIIPALLFGRPIARAFGGWRSAVGRAATALMIAPVCFGLGSAVWFYYNTCTHWGSLACGAGDEVPYPSWADAGYLAVLPFILIALWSMGRVLALRGRDLLTVVTIFVVLFIPTALMTWSFEIGGSSHGKAWLYDSESPGFFDAIGIVLRGDATAADLGNLISGIYVITDVVLIATALVLISFSRRVAGGLFFPPIVSVAVACSFQYVADMLFFQRVFAETYFNGDISDVFYFLAMFTLVTSVFLFGRAYRAMTAGIEVHESTPRPATEPAVASEGVV